MGYHRGMVSMQGLGYKEIRDYLDDKITLEEAIYRIKRDTRHFAKRQLTWFRRERDVIWVDKSEIGSDTEALLFLVRGRIIIPCSCEGMDLAAIPYSKRINR